MGGDAAEEGEGLGDGGGAEEDQGEADEVEGQEGGEDAAGERWGAAGGAAGASALPEEDGGEAEAVEGAPDEEVPGEAVPKTAEQERDQEGGGVTEEEMLAAFGEGFEDVVGEPGGEGDVPALPEVLQVECEVRTAEVLGKFNADEERNSHGKIGIAGEVEEELEGVAVDGDEVLEAAVEGGGVEDAIDEVVGEVVSDEEFFDQAGGDEQQGAGGDGLVEVEGREHLLDEARLAGNGAGDDRRKEVGGGEIGEVVGGGLRVFAVDVDGVAEGLEAVEGETKGEQPAVAVADGEGHCLDEDEQAEVEDERGQQQTAAMRRCATRGSDGAGE